MVHCFPPFRFLSILCPCCIPPGTFIPMRSQCNPNPIFFHDNCLLGIFLLKFLSMPVFDCIFYSLLFYFQQFPSLLHPFPFRPELPPPGCPAPAPRARQHREAERRPPSNDHPASGRRPPGLLYCAWEGGSSQRSLTGWFDSCSQKAALVNFIQGLLYFNTPFLRNEE